jgi:hypothetical protein
MCSYFLVRITGYSAFEARLALRATGNDLTKAVGHVEALVKKKQEMREMRIQVEKRRQLERRLGYLPGPGNIRLNADVFEQLTRLGYTRQQARLGLLKGGNTLAGALDALSGGLSVQSADAERVSNIIKATVVVVCRYVYRQPGLLCTPRNFAQSSKLVREKIFFGTKVASEAVIIISQNLKVTRLQGGTQTTLDLLTKL